MPEINRGEGLRMKAPSATPGAPGVCGRFPVRSLESPCYIGWPRIGSPVAPHARSTCFPALERITRRRALSLCSFLMKRLFSRLLSTLPRPTERSRLGWVEEPLAPGGRQVKAGSPARDSRWFWGNLDEGARLRGRRSRRTDSPSARKLSAGLGSHVGESAGP